MEPLGRLEFGLLALRRLAFGAVVLLVFGVLFGNALPQAAGLALLLVLFVSAGNSLVAASLFMLTFMAFLFNPLRRRLWDAGLPSFVAYLPVVTGLLAALPYADTRWKTIFLSFHHPFLYAFLAPILIIALLPSGSFRFDLRYPMTPDDLPVMPVSPAVADMTEATDVPAVPAITPAPQRANTRQARPATFGKRGHN